MGPTGPRGAPYWPHEPCYLGIYRKSGWLGTPGWLWTNFENFQLHWMTHSMNFITMTLTYWSVRKRPAALVPKPMLTCSWVRFWAILVRASMPLLKATFLCDNVENYTFKTSPTSPRAQCTNNLIYTYSYCRYPSKLCSRLPSGVVSVWPQQTVKSTDNSTSHEPCHAPRLKMKIISSHCYLLNTFMSMQMILLMHWSYHSLALKPSIYSVWI